MTWFEYSMNFYKTADLGDAINRLVFYSELWSKKRYKIRGIRERREDPIIDLYETGQTHASNYLLVPESLEEMEIFKADTLKILSEFDEKAICIKESGVSRIDDKGFKIWKLMRQIKEEKDEAKLRQLLSEAIK